GGEAEVPAGPGPLPDEEEGGQREGEEEDRGDLEGECVAIGLVGRRQCFHAAEDRAPGEESDQRAQVPEPDPDPSDPSAVRLRADLRQERVVELESGLVRDVRDAEENERRKDSSAL